MYEQYGRLREASVLLAGPPVTSGVIEVLGPNGQGPRNVRISAWDQPSAIEHCLRAAFGLPPTASVLLSDADGCAVPLGPGLLMQLQQPGPEDVGCKRTSSAPFRLEVVQQAHAQAKLVGAKSGSLPQPEAHRRNSPEILQLPGVVSKRIRVPGCVVMPTMSVVEEQRFWIMLAEECRLGSEVSPDDHFRQLVAFDTSAHRIDQVFHQWADPDGHIPYERLRHCLVDETGVVLGEQQLDEALQRVQAHLRVKECSGILDAHGMVVVNRAVFSSMWQRLMLGAICRHMPTDWEESFRRDIMLMRYTQRHFSLERCTDEQLFFRSPKDVRSQDCMAQWVRADHAGPNRLVKFGVKFYLHPATTKDAITAASVGITRIDRYRHQYFVSLETYALRGRDTLGHQVHKQGSGLRWAEDAARCVTPTLSGKFARVKSIPLNEEPPPVAELVVRSSMFLVATGNPHVGHRDWILSIVNAEREDLPDPNDFFRNDPGAAVQVLDDVQRELEAHGRLREYRADFLLYSIIDNAVTQVMPICISYGHRLRYLHRRLDVEKLRIPAEHVQEVSRARLELQELRQWVGQMLGIMSHLEDDCKGDIDSENGQLPWNFGMNVSGPSKTLLISIHNTQSHLGQIADRLSVLDEVSRSFTDSHSRYRDAFTNQTLLMLTVATAAFMPAQFLAGVYGTNFVLSDGQPAIPELRHKYGYLIFWLVSVGLVLTGAGTLYCCVRRRSL